MTDLSAQATGEWFRPSPRPRPASGIIEAPLLPVRETVVFPHMVTPLFVGRDRSMKAIEAAQHNNETLIVVTQRDAETEDPRPEDLYLIGSEVIVGARCACPTAHSILAGPAPRRDSKFRRSTVFQGTRAVDRRPDQQAPATER
jgi:hypothetical protein